MSDDKPTVAKPIGTLTAQFEEVVALIKTARHQALRTVNTYLVDLCWNIGALVSQRIESDGWGKGTVTELATYVARSQPGARGFSAQNLWRMRQFYETYRDAPNLQALTRELPWSSNLHILGSKSVEEREFYLRMAVKMEWDVREVARQIKAGAFERALTSPPKLSTALRELHPDSGQVFKDLYSLEFLGLPASHSENNLQQAILRDLGRFITELGADFCFVGSEYPVQVGARDFAIDLVFFHRGLACLVAFELKVGRFEPEHLGKLSFYVEALDRTVKKPHERPSIGVLLCASKDDEVVEFALARTASPTLVAEYQTVLPPKELLRAKLHEIYARLSATENQDEDES
jgi:predicted nuclease of restriction endonuclease-like (RecB) superfamily